MKNLLAFFGVSLFVVTTLFIGVSGKALSIDGSQEPLKTDKIQLAKPTNDPCVYKGRLLTVDIRSIAAKFK